MAFGRRRLHSVSHQRLIASQARGEHGVCALLRAMAACRSGTAAFLSQATAVAHASSTRVSRGVAILRSAQPCALPRIASGEIGRLMAPATSVVVRKGDSAMSRYMRHVVGRPATPARLRRQRTAIASAMSRFIVLGGIGLAGAVATPTVAVVLVFGSVRFAPSHTRSSKMITFASLTTRSLDLTRKT